MSARLRWGALLGGLTAAGCAFDAPLLPPQGLSDSARLLFVDPASLPACGIIEELAIPPRGHLPVLSSLKPRSASEPPLLLELDAEPFRAAYADDRAVPLFRARVMPPTVLDADDARLIPPPLHAWRLSGGAFEPVSVDSPQVAALGLAFLQPNACRDRLTDRCDVELSQGAEDPRCDELETTTAYVPNAQGGGVGLVLGLDDNTALAAALPSLANEHQPRFYTLDGTSGRAQEVTALPELMPYLAGFPAANGDFFALGPGDRVAHGDLTRGFDLILTSTKSYTDPRTAWVDGPHDLGTPLELFAFLDDGSFLHFDGTSIVHLTGIDPQAAAGGGGVAWIAPGEAIAAGVRRGELLHYRDGTLRVEEAPVRGDDQPTTIANLPGKGLVLGTVLGTLYLYDGTAWRHLTNRSDGSPVRAIVPFGNGFIYASGITESGGGLGGRVVQYSWDFGLCKPRLISDRDIRRLFPRPGGGFLALAKEAPTDAFVVFARAKDKYPQCSQAGN